jgi:tRNA threonylcarbamoyl adenosine modification protein YeaZ
MKSLFIDTATDTGVVGLFEGDRLLHSRTYPAAFANSKLLLPAILELISSPKELAYIGVGIGPGSYTGIRVAVATAKGIAYGANLPLVGVPTLRAFVPEKGEIGTFVAAIDARIGGIYALKGIVEDGCVRFLEKEALLSLEDFKKFIEGVDFLITPDSEVLQKRLSELSVHVVQRTPSLKQFGALAHAEFMAGRVVLDGNLPLLYLRKTQAEIERQR